MYRDHLSRPVINDFKYRFFLPSLNIFEYLSILFPFLMLFHLSFPNFPFVIFSLSFLALFAWKSNYYDFESTYRPFSTLLFSFSFCCSPFYMLHCGQHWGYYIIPKEQLIQHLAQGLKWTLD